MPAFFTGFFIDLRDIQTGTETKIDKLKIIKLFEDHLIGNHDSKLHLEQYINPTNNTKYNKGL